MFNLQPNGISLVEGKSLLVTKGGEKATAILDDLNVVRPHDPRSSTGITFFSTNSQYTKLRPLQEGLQLECRNGKVLTFHLENN